MSALLGELKATCRDETFARQAGGIEEGATHESERAGEQIKPFGQHARHGQDRARIAKNQTFGIAIGSRNLGGVDHDADRDARSRTQDL